MWLYTNLGIDTVPVKQEMSRRENLKYPYEEQDLAKGDNIVNE